MKKVFALTFLLFAVAFAVKAQKIDSIYFNLYTDSLKRGTQYYNYINVDGKLSNGNYLPLDSTKVKFTCSAGKMSGNVLQLETEEKAEFIVVTATLIENPAVTREVKIYVKRVILDPPLKTTDELLKEWNKKKKN